MSSTPFLRKRWTLEECSRLVKVGVLTEPVRYELIDGDITIKTKQTPAHSFVLIRTFTSLTAVLESESVRVGAGIGGVDPYSDPEPDLSVVRGTLRDYLERVPHPSREIALVVEVADDELTQDLTVKAVLYARAGVPDYWIVDVGGRRLIVHRQPGPNGYAELVFYTENQTLAPLADSSGVVRVADLLP